MWLGNGSSFWSTCFSCFDLVLLWCLLIQCLGATQGIPPSDHFYPFLGSAAQGHLAVLVAYVLYSGGVHVVNTMQCCVSVKPLPGGWLGVWNSCYCPSYLRLIIPIDFQWLPYSFRPLKPPISWSQMDRLWRTAGVSTLCTLSTETKRVGETQLRAPKNPGWLMMLGSIWDLWWSYYSLKIVGVIGCGMFLLVRDLRDPNSRRCDVHLWFDISWDDHINRKPCFGIGGSAHVWMSWDRQTNYDTTYSWLGYLDSCFFCEALLGVKIPRSAPSCRPQDVLLIFLPDWQGRAGYDYLLLRFGPGTGEEVNVGLVTQPHWNLIEFAIFLAWVYWSCWKMLNIEAEGGAESHDDWLSAVQPFWFERWNEL